MTGDRGSERTSQQLRADSDAFLANLERLLELESEKRTVPPNDPHFRELAQEIERVAEGLLVDARIQTELGGAVKATGGSTPIDDVPDTLNAYQIIQAWRDAERRLESLDPTSPEADQERASVEHYRRAYQRVYGRTQARDQDEER